MTSYFPYADAPYPHLLPPLAMAYKTQSMI
uniref:Uncharacterized protein n=1 Tax=Arundo donax TaxID=35708 RepID=A0A0A8Z7U0_ARUDO